MDKRDPYNNEEKWEAWKEKYFNNPPKGINKENWKLLINFLKDMELGLNTPKGSKGKRQAGTLLNVGSHNTLFLKHFKKPLNQLTKQDLHNLEKNIESGKILKKDGTKFIAFGNYIKDFKVFWNWLLRTKRVDENLTEDISIKTDKPHWVYLDEEKIKIFFNQLSFDYRVICWLLYDTGARVTETNSLRVKDFSDNFTKVTIPDEASKTFGRTINLKICSSLLKEYVKLHNLKDDDYILIKKPFTINKYLKLHCGKFFGKDKISNPKSKGRYGEFTIYDIRHNSACYWFNRYPTQKGLMYRFGWRKADKIEYYSEFLGVNDEIKDDDLVLAEDKGKLYKLEQKMEVQDKRLAVQAIITRILMDYQLGKINKKEYEEHKVKLKSYIKKLGLNKEYDIEE